MGRRTQWLLLLLKDYTIMQYSKSPLLVKLAALATAAALSGSVFAATPAATSSTPVAAEQGGAVASSDHKQSHSRKHMRHHHREAAMWVPGYGPLGEKAVQSLALNDSQAKLLEEAKNSQKELRKDRRETMKSAKAEQFKQLEAGTMDPRAALKADEAKRQAAMQAHQKGNEKWLAVWDALDQSQQKKVAEIFSEHAKKRTERASKHARGDHKAATAAGSPAAATVAS
jgi:hypothetical protein